VSVRAELRRLALALVVALAAPASAGATAVTTRSAVFTVTNVNRSLVPCATNGRSYRVHGLLVGPADELATNGGSATIYLHGLGFAAFFWNFTAVRSYDFARQMARRGHVSVIIDRLGYGATDHPPGTESCTGGQADVAHQIVTDLRRGSYAVSSGRPISFARLALVGHSAGGAVAQVEAYSFDDVDALGVLSYADQGQSLLALETFASVGLTCVTGGRQSDGAPGYAPFGATGSEFDAIMFHDADPAVIAAATAMRTFDPCGDDDSLAQTVVLDQLLLSTIHVPVLLLYGANDALFPPPSGTFQRLHFSGTHDVTLTELPDTGHAVTLERTHATLVCDLSRWLRTRGF
jgi:pimeloyl-ACP methyl ester carboxylesterase